MSPPPSQFYFFLRSIRHPKRWTNVLPPCVPPVRITSPTPPPPPTPSFGWLLRRTIEQRPSKTDAPPVLQFFDGRHFGAPNKGTKRSTRAPGRRPPPSGSWGAAAMRFGSMAGVSMEREGEAAGMSGDGGSSCVLCFFVMSFVLFGEPISYIRAWYYQSGGLFVPLFPRNATCIGR